MKNCPHCKLELEELTGVIGVDKKGDYDNYGKIPKRHFTAYECPQCGQFFWFRDKHYGEFPQ